MRKAKRSAGVIRTLSLLIGLTLVAPAYPATLTPSPVMLANVYHAGITLSDYWVSEKYDGVRGYWDGETLRTRSGAIIPAPAWFTAKLPKTPMDGELWAGRDRFEQASSTIRQQSADDEAWRHMRYMVFDLPAHPGTFDQRIPVLQKLVAQIDCPWVQAVSQFKVANAAELQRKLDDIVQGGGEGLVLHRGASLYRAGRTGDLLKLKPFDDAEARVVAHVPGKGKYAGMMGSLLVELPDGTRFRIGTGFTDEQRHGPPPVGSTVTFRYQGKTAGGKPRFARFMRVRDEL
ncbi:DNA ligase [Dyella nitratireducens]|uniref:ATP-dependent DNA ligase n=1 Tax=Dyella nitratireducens TaxID=1849580 RepID=A0ABQ1FNK1_9GAMM|nr:DNA ligase [Dyella nitratireducens]GGA23040.1 ATP-dependent DNA ligase [Dyella nitratireducens]GLQ44030.1 ATP-dependent DNA ligase [Dyella nitratireducens]